MNTGRVPIGVSICTSDRSQHPRCTPLGALPDDDLLLWFMRMANALLYSASVQLKTV